MGRVEAHRFSQTQAVDEESLMVYLDIVRDSYGL